MVVGSINADVVVSAPQIPAPGATVIGHGVAVGPGGKGLNQAVAAARAGAQVQLAGCLGSDFWGDRMSDFLASTTIDSHLVERVDTATGLALITVADDGENSIVVVPGANRGVEIAGAVRTATDELRGGDVLVAVLELPPPVVEGALRRGNEAGAVTLLNASPVSEVSAECLDRASVVIVNQEEAAALDLPHRRRDGQVVVVTLGARGARLTDDRGTTEIEPRDTRAVDTTGAGDCFAGVLAAGLAAGESIVDSAGRAAIAASLQVERAGAAQAMPTRAEIASA